MLDDDRGQRRRRRLDHRCGLRRGPGARCRELAAVADPDTLPLFGIPFAVKDSIDIAGWPTTLACPGYAYEATETAPVVARLLDAGAVLIGKTNLDQFATGLNGTRTPYTVPRSVYGQGLISGGSSSGSALAVALGEVPFAVATDTAGSGRVPPALNGILRLQAVARADQHGRAGPGVPIAGLHQPDGGQRRRSGPGLRRGGRPGSPRSVEPDSAARTGLGRSRRSGSDCRRSMTSSSSVISRWPRRTGGRGASSIDISRSSRYRCNRSSTPDPCCTRDPGSPSGTSSSVSSWPANRRRVLPVIAEIINGGARFSATDVFRAQYRLAELKSLADELFERVDVVVLPTIGTTFTVDEVLAAPITTNTTLGHYTHCGNLLDLCAVAVPAGLTADGRPASCHGARTRARRRRRPGRRRRAQALAPLLIARPKETTHDQRIRTHRRRRARSLRPAARPDRAGRDRHAARLPAAGRLRRDPRQRRQPARLGGAAAAAGTGRGARGRTDDHPHPRGPRARPLRPAPRQAPPGPTDPAHRRPRPVRPDPGPRRVRPRHHRRTGPASSARS